MNKLQLLEEMRSRAGIVFKKSFRCKDAEKNIHLLDKDKFFKKFLEKLKNKGYDPLEDLEFDVIRHKYNYTQRHHVGRTYEWKYFYSSTFDISDELIDYLVRHNFATKHVEKEKVKTSTTTNKSNKPKKHKKELPLSEQIEVLNGKIEKTKEHIEFHELKVKESREIGDAELTKRYNIVLHKYKVQLSERTEQLENLLAEYEQTK